MTDIAPAEQTTPDPMDPRNYPHHYIVKPKDQKANVRSFHVSPTCPSIERVPDTHEKIDLDIAVVEYLGLTPCGHCTLVAKSENQADVVIAVLEAVSEAHKTDGRRLDRSDVAGLILAELFHQGFEFRKGRTNPGRRPNGPSPLEKFANGEDSWAVDDAPSIEPPPTQPVPTPEATPAPPIPDDGVTATSPEPQPEATPTPATVEAANPTHTDDAEAAAAQRTLESHLEARHSTIPMGDFPELLRQHAEMHEAGEADHDHDDLTA